MSYHTTNGGERVLSYRRPGPVLHRRASGTGKRWGKHWNERRPPKAVRPQHAALDAIAHRKVDYGR